MKDLRFCEQVWTTASGQKIPFSKVSHQHWSNIYWYHEYIAHQLIDGKDEDYGVLADFAKEKKETCERITQLALDQLKLRFNGVLMDWEPVYENEKKWYITFKRKVLIEKYVKA